MSDPKENKDVVELNEEELNSVAGGNAHKAKNSPGETDDHQGHAGKGEKARQNHGKWA